MTSLPEAHGTALISVVIPTYNRGHLIRGALDSIACQDYRPLEVIVVDDGSTDNTTEAVRSWMSSRRDGLSLRLVRQKNQGGNAARNAGIRAARGELVAFLDSDDQWHADKLSRQHAVLRDDARIGGVYCGVRHDRLDSGDPPLSYPREYPAGELLDELLVRDVTAPTSTYLVRREVFDTVGDFDEALQARQDWDMWIRMASRYHIGVVPEPLVDYGEHAGERTASNPQKEIAAYRRIMLKYASLRASRSLGVRRAAHSALMRRMGRVHLHHGLGRGTSLVFYLKAVLAWPFDFDNYAALAGWFLPGGLRRKLHLAWNRVFGASPLSIRSH